MADEQRLEQAQSVILTPKQARAIIALQFEREEIARHANEQIDEIMGAFQEQGAMLALIHQLPRGEAWAYIFESTMVDGTPRIKMTARPKDELPPEEAGDGR